MGFASRPDSKLALLQALWVCTSGVQPIRDPRFGRIARIAAALFDVSIALISLDGEEGGAGPGMLGSNSRRAGRFRGLCARLAPSEKPLIIEDAASDHRFGYRAAAMGEIAVRFLASAPVRSRTGQRLGALTLLDRFPRSFNDGEVKLLEELVGVVEDLLSADEAARRDKATGAFERDTFVELGERSLTYARRHSLATALVLLQPYIVFEDLAERHARRIHAVMTEVTDIVRNASRIPDLVGRVSEDRVGILMFGCTEYAATGRLARMESLLAARWQQRFGAEVLAVRSLIIAGLDVSTDSVAGALEDAEQWIAGALDSDPVH